MKEGDSLVRDPEGEVDRWLAEEEDDKRSPKGKPEGGQLIPFPKKMDPDQVGEDDASDKERESEEIGEKINRAAAEGASLEGGKDPSEVSINVHDEAFFAADYAPDPYSDQLFSDFEDSHHDGGRGKWWALGVLVVVAGVAIPSWYYGIHKNPYVGDGPAELQINPNRLIGGAGALGGDAAGSGKTLAAQHPRLDSSSPVKDQGIPVVASREDASLHDSAHAKVAVDATLARQDRGVPKKTTAGTSSKADAGPSSADAKAAPSADEQYATLIKKARELMKKRRRAQAYRLLFKARKLNPNGWEALDYLAWREYNRGREKVGKTLAQKALAGSKDAPYANLVMGAVAHGANKKAEAIQGYERFLKLCPTCPEVGDIKQALKSLKPSK